MANSLTYNHTKIHFAEGSAPTTPDAGEWVVYTKSDGLYVMDDAGTETGPLAEAGGASQLDYAQITSNASITATSAATANTVITGGSVAYDGSAVWVEFYSPFTKPDNAAAGRDITIGIFESTTEIGRLAFLSGASTTAAYVAVYGKFRFTPSAASHTYLIKAWVSAGTGVIGAGAGGAAAAPAFMRITRA